MIRPCPGLKRRKRRLRFNRLGKRFIIVSPRSIGKSRLMQDLSLELLTENRVHWPMSPEGELWFTPNRIKKNLS